MYNVENVDTNFKVVSKRKETDIKFYDVKKAPFKIYGLMYESGRFRRIPENVAKSVSEEVTILHSNTAGGRVRFKTDSRYVAIYSKMPKISKMPHFALTGSAGFDLYVREEGKEEYVSAYIPPKDLEDGYEGILYFETSEMRDFTINFPLYSDVSELFVGLQDSAVVSEPDPYKIETPVVFYGSSITQGACASRPGNSYENIVSRKLDFNYINLGFSGNAKAEPEIAEYISNLNMSVFVYDYDHNAPTAEYLAKTHERMFKTIREKNPDLPIVMMSRPKFKPDDDEKLRVEIIKRTYENAKKNGDENVYFIDGITLFGLSTDEGLVDRWHPNDWGFVSMAKAVSEVLEKIL